MKKLLYIGSFRDLKRQWRGFLFLIILLSVGMGLYMSGRTGEALLMEQIHSVYHNQQRSDIDIQSVIGFTMAQQEALEEAFPDWVMEGGREQFGLVNQSVVKLLAYEVEGDLNRPFLLEGRDIQEPWEVLVSPDFLGGAFEIGDWISVEDLEESSQGESVDTWDGTSKGDLSQTGTLLGLTEPFQIVGTAISPLYLSPDYGNPSFGDGQVKGMMFLDLGEENPSHIYLKSDEISTQASGGTLLDGDALESLDILESLGEVLWREQTTSLILAQETVERTLSQQLTEEEERQAQWGVTMLEEGKYWETEISLAWATYEAESSWRSEAQNQQVREDIADLETMYQQSLGDWEAMMEEGEQILSNLRKELGQGQRDLLLLQEGGWTYHFWEDNSSYERYVGETAQLGRLGQAFPVVFYGVCLLIAWAMVSQMIQEQRKSIATLCSLGYQLGEIMGKYLFFVLLVLFFATLGAGVIGFVLLPRWIYQLWSDLFYLGDVPRTSFSTMRNHWEVWVSAWGMAVAMLVGAVICTCGTVLQKMPAVLYRPMSAKKSGRIWLEKIDILWHDLSFEEKITLRNVFRNPKRTWGSIFAIALVTGVMVSAFGLVDATSRGVTRQYMLLYRHDTEIILEEDVTYEEYLEVKGVLASYQYSQNYTELSAQTVVASGVKGAVSTVLYTVEDAEALDRVLYLRQNPWKVYGMPSTGATVPLKLAETLGLSLGDTIVIEGEFGRAEAMVTALSEFYTSQTILMSHEYYERITESPVNIHCFWLKDGAMVEDMLSDLRGLEGVSRVSPRYEEYLQYMGLGLSDPLLYGLVIASVVLVALVLGYLNHHNVSGRQVELGTLKVFGLSDYEISAYFYRENIVVTFYGLLLGLVVGQNFHYWFVRTLESSTMMLYRGVALERFIYGAGMVAVVALLVNLWMYHKFQRFEITRALQGMRE